MDIVTTKGNPAPAGATPAFIRTVDGVTLRTLRWNAAESRGTVVIALGRAEYAEKYFETASDLLARGFSIVLFDWRGQGLSSRELSDRSKGHIDDFNLYEIDLDAVREQTLEPFCPKPWFGLGHSMGGAVLLAQAHNRRSPFERIVLSAPMIDLPGPKSRMALIALTEFLDILGFGGSIAPGGSKKPHYLGPFEKNRCTSDPRRYQRSAEVLTFAPELSVGAPTIGWVNAAFRQMRQFSDPEYPRRIPVPTLIVVAGADQVVNGRAAEKFGRRLKSGDVVLIPRARHDILVERDVYRKQFFAAFDAFVPGEPIPVEPQADDDVGFHRLAGWRALFARRFRQKSVIA